MGSSLSNIHSQKVKEIMAEKKICFWDALQFYITTHLQKNTPQEKRVIREKLESDYIFSDLEL
jgi:hypothetical protein